MSVPTIEVEIAPVCALEIPAVGDWLTADERAELARWQLPARRTEWLAGRWLAKQAVAERIKSAALGEISISSYCPESRRGSPPRVTLQDQPWPGTLSIAHVDGWVAVALSRSGQVPLGVDIASFQSLSPGFGGFWFTASEQAAVANKGRWEGLRYWAAKEALFKAFGSEQAFRPQDYELCRNAQQRLIVREAPDKQIYEFEYSAGVAAVACPAGCTIRTCHDPFRRDEPRRVFLHEVCA